MSQDTVKLQEEQHLNHTIEKIGTAKAELQAKLKQVGDDNLERLADLRSNPETGVDFDIFLEQLNEKNLSFNIKDKLARLEEYEYLYDNPYFARIDLINTETGITEQIYIGKFGYTQNVPVVTDWRADIASVYYRYRFPQKRVEYNTQGGIETRDLLLKRTFDIYQGQLVKYYNNDIQLDENEIIIDKISRRTGGVLEDIVETIQKDQMDIIQADPRQICIVQGCVGSGKSTVAIHKLAHIFFHFKNYIHPQKSVLIVKNQILIGYLATLFPKLGIFDINYKTLSDLMINFIFREKLSITADFESEHEDRIIDLKALTNIYNDINLYHKRYEEKISKLFADPSYESYGGYKYSTNLTPAENLQEVFNELNEELETQKESLKEYSRTIRALVYKNNIKNLKAIIRKINDIKLELSSRDFIEILTTYGVHTNKKLGYVETLLYILIYCKLIGLKKIQPYEYCIIDEGQDFSLLEYAVLSNFVFRGRFGIFGDLNQGLSTEGIREWSDIQHVILEAKTAKTFSLQTNYRSTKQIIETANKILGRYTKKYLPNSLNRNGPTPLKLILNTQIDLINEFNKLIKSDVGNLTGSIGIICYTKQLEDAAAQALDSGGYLYKKLDRTVRINYSPKGVYLMSLENCKGLEFAKAYILGLNVDKISNDSDARKAFVAVTRAMNELIILGF